MELAATALLIAESKAAKEKGVGKGSKNEKTAASESNKSSTSKSTVDTAGQSKKPPVAIQDRVVQGSKRVSVPAHPSIASLRTTGQQKAAHNMAVSTPILFVIVFTTFYHGCTYISLRILPERN